MQLLAHNQRVAVALMLYKKVLIISNALSERTSSFNNNSSRGNNNKIRLIKNWLGWRNQLQMWHLNFWSRISSMSERAPLWFISHFILRRRSQIRSVYIYFNESFFTINKYVYIFMDEKKKQVCNLQKVSELSFIHV